MPDSLSVGLASWRRAEASCVVLLVDSLFSMPPRTMGNQLSVNSIQDAVIDRFRSVALTTDANGAMRIRSFSEGVVTTAHHHHHQQEQNQQLNQSPHCSGRGGRILRESSIDGGVAMFDALLRDDHEHRLSLDAVHRMRHVRTSCTTIPEEDAVSDRSLQLHLSTLARERENEREREREREREVSWKVVKCRKAENG